MYGVVKFAQVTSQFLLFLNDFLGFSCLALYFIKFFMFILLTFFLAFIKFVALISYIYMHVYIFGYKDMHTEPINIARFHLKSV